MEGVPPHPTPLFHTQRQSTTSTPAAASTHCNTVSLLFPHLLLHQTVSTSLISSSVSFFLFLYLQTHATKKPPPLVSYLPFRLLFPFFAKSVRLLTNADFSLPFVFLCYGIYPRQLVSKETKHEQQTLAGGRSFACLPKKNNTKNRPSSFCPCATQRLRLNRPTDRCGKKKQTRPAGHAACPALALAALPLACRAALSAATKQTTPMGRRTATSQIL